MFDVLEKWPKDLFYFIVILSAESHTTRKRNAVLKISVCVYTFIVVTHMIFQSWITTKKKNSRKKTSLQQVHVYFLFWLFECWFNTMYLKKTLLRSCHHLHTVFFFIGLLAKYIISDNKRKKWLTKQKMFQFFLCLSLALCVYMNFYFL